MVSWKFYLIKICSLAETQFLYYLFDRHWRTPDESWRYIIDDFAATFSISRHSLLESLTFYLLDDHTEEALQVNFAYVKVGLLSALHMI